MKDFFRMDTDEHRLSLLAKARQVALFALQQYDLAWERIQFIQLSDTITYKIETSTAEKYLLRIHSDRWSKDEIRSELMMLQAFRHGAGITVPEGLASRDGSCVLEVDTEEGYRRPYVTMMRWLEGEVIEGEMTEGCSYNMGVLVGKLHEAAAQFNPPSHFVRPTWGIESFRRELARLEKYYPIFLSEEAWKGYQAAADKIISSLALIPKNKDTYGLIHADLHTGNIVFQNDTPFPIDFGRCGYGYHLYDIAGTILGLYPKHREIFIQGYQRVRTLEAEYVQQLECFFVMNMIENYCHHASDPREISSLIAEQPYAQAIIRDFLKGVPFVFQVNEPWK